MLIYVCLNMCTCIIDGERRKKGVERNDVIKTRGKIIVLYSKRVCVSVLVFLYDHRATFKPIF